MINELLLSSFPKVLDLTSSEHLELLETTVDSLMDKFETVDDISKVENEFINKNDDSYIFVLLVLKLLKSRFYMSKIDKQVTVSIIFAVYNEHNRIKTKNEHPHGEDFLKRKISQLEWFFKNKKNFNWEIIVVDDGCPNKSGEIAKEIINSNNLNDKAKVIFLEKAINDKLDIVENLTSTKDSQKGGSISYGMWYAAAKQTKKETENHIIIYTDADLSTHLGQVGLLINPILKQNKTIAIGSRREVDSTVIKKGTRNNRGKLFIYLWKRLIPNLGNIIDTQCGFKAFKKEVAVKIIDNLIEKKFAFDIELLLKAELLNKNTIEKVAIAWIDSEEASTTTDLQPYLPMLKSIAKMYKKYFPMNKKSEEFYKFINSLDEESFIKLIENIPTSILEKDPSEFTKFDKINALDLENIIKS